MQNITKLRGSGETESNKMHIRGIDVCCSVHVLQRENKGEKSCIVKQVLTVLNMNIRQSGLHCLDIVVYNGNQNNSFHRMICIQ